MEKFNPSDEKYRKIKDLPEEHQDNYADVKGGFISKEAMGVHEATERTAAYENEDLSFLSLLTGRGVVTPKDIAHEWALRDAEKENRRLTVKKDLEMGTLGESFDSLSFKEKGQYLETAKEVVLEESAARKEAEILNRAMEGMRQLGHEGALFYKDCQSGGCWNLYGDIDGKKINLHTDGRGGEVGDVAVGDEVAREFLRAYGNAAVRLGRNYNLRDLVQREANKEMSTLSSDEAKTLASLKEKYVIAKEEESARLKEEDRLEKMRRADTERDAIQDLLPKKQ